MADNKENIFAPLSGKILGLVFQKNGRVRINPNLLIKRKKKKKYEKRSEEES